MDNLISPLEKIGLTRREALVYMALLRFGNATVADIAAETQIKRPTAYLILDELRHKGLVLKIPYAKKAIYQAKNPDELYEQAVHNINDFEKALPRLRSMKPSHKAVRTLYFEGVDGMREGLYYGIDKLENKTLKCFWAKADLVPKVITDLYGKINKKFAEKGVTVEGITPADPSIKIYKDDFPAGKYKVQWVPKDIYSSDVSIEISDFFIRIIDPIDLKVVIIEDDRIVMAFKQIFAIAMEKFTK